MVKQVSDNIKQNSALSINTLPSKGDEFTWDGEYFICIDRFGYVGTVLNIYDNEIIPNFILIEYDGVVPILTGRKFEI